MKANDELAGRIGVALRDEQPELALHTLVRSLLEEGRSRAEMVARLRDYRGTLSGEHRETDDELILDVMAVLDGWASDTAVRNLMPKPCDAPRAWSLSEA